MKNAGFIFKNVLLILVLTFLFSTAVHADTTYWFTLSTSNDNGYEHAYLTAEDANGRQVWSYSSGYYPVTEPEDSSIDCMRRKWAKHRETVRACHQHYGKPVMFAEIGVRSEHGCTQFPWDFRHRPGQPLDEQEQADFYETAMEAMWDEPYFRGFFWWDWKAILPPEETAHSNRDFTVYGKQAETVLRRWYTEH